MRKIKPAPDPLPQLAELLRKHALEIGLGTAYVAFGLTFRGPPRQFWNRMTITGLVLGSFALATEAEPRAIQATPKDVAVGLGSAGVLYGIFVVGDKLARRIMPRGGAEIASIYDLSTLGRRLELGARLALIIGPAEELFWRGLVQKHLAARYGRWWGAVLGTLAYGGVHIVTGNATLLGAASVAGAFWSGLYVLDTPMSALIISHASWDVLTFLVAPIAPSSGEH